MRTDVASSRARVAALTRRRVLSGFVAASAAVVAAHPARLLAQTPGATPVADAGPTLPADASDAFRAVAEAFAAAMEATGTPGGALGILAEGREEYAEVGLADVERGEAVAAETLFQIGSITKTYTGTAVMRLVEAGALDLDATVRTYLPDFRLPDEDVAERVTIRHLLTHTGGWWGDLFVDTGGGDDAIEAYVARWFPELPQLSPLGEFVSYNNAGFILLGRLIEEAAGQEYRAAMDELVLAPLGLGDSFFAPEDVSMRPHALGYFSADGDVQVQEPLFLPRAVDPAGGVWSTTRDLLRYARFHLGDGTVEGERVLATEMLELMQTPQEAILGDPTSAMGLPWFVADLLGQRLVLHDGGTFGQHAQLWLAPDRPFALALFVNALPAGAFAAQAALGEALNQYFGMGPETMPMATPVASPPAAALPAALPPVELEQYAGTYETPDATYRLEVVDGMLLLSQDLHPHPAQIQPLVRLPEPPELPLEFVAEDVALVTYQGIPILLVFVRDDEGEIGWVSAGLRLIPKVAA